MKQYSDIVLKVTGKDESLVEYKKAEAFTTKIKTVEFSKATNKPSINARYWYRKDKLICTKNVPFLGKWILG